MIDWQDKVERSRLLCHRSGRVIEPGSAYYSALRFLDGRFLRHDYAEDQWQDQDGADSLSWWRHRRPPVQEDKGPRMVGHGVLLAIFHDIKSSTRRHEQCFAWLLALLLVRAKKLRYHAMERHDNATWLLVQDRASKETLRIRDPHMDSEEERQVLGNLADIFEMPPQDLAAGAPDEAVVP